MFSIFQKDSYRNSIGFEDIKIAIKSTSKYIIINTLELNQQDILIENTVNVSEEENIINKILYVYSEPDRPIIIYGKNSTDSTALKKYDQLVKLGIKDVYIYYGGLFEWLLLNELYGNEEFPVTNNSNVDLLKYRPKSLLN
jgi:rhodanese-related sulfurtransferase